MWGGHRGCGEGTGHGWGDPTGAVPGGAELRYPGKSPLRRHRPRHRYRLRPVPTAPPCPHLCGSIVAGSVGRSCRCLMPWWPPCAPGAARLGFRPPLRFRFPGGGGTERNGTGRRGEERREEERGGAGQHLAPAGLRGWGHRERGATGHGHRERPGEEEPGAAVTGSTGHGGPGTTWVWGSREHPWVRGAREHRAPGTQGDLGMGESGTGEIPPGCQGGEPAPARVGGSCPGAGRVHPEAGGEAEQPPLGARGFGVCSAACWRSSPAAAPTLSSPWLRACLDLGTPAGLCSHLCWRLSSGQSFAAFPG